MDNMKGEELVNQGMVTVKDRTDTRIFQELVRGGTTYYQRDDVSHGQKGETNWERASYTRRIDKISPAGDLTLIQTGRLTGYEGEEPRLDTRHFESFLTRKGPDTSGLWAHGIRFAPDSTGSSSRILTLLVHIPDSRASISLHENVYLNPNINNTPTTRRYSSLGITFQEGDSTWHIYNVDVGPDGKVSSMFTATENSPYQAASRDFQQVEEKEAQQIWEEKIRPEIDKARAMLTDDPEGWVITNPDKKPILPLLDPANFPKIPLSGFVADQL